MWESGDFPEKGGCCSLADTLVEVPSLTVSASFGNAFALAAVGIPEVFQTVFVRAWLDFADLALTSFFIELFIRVGAVVSDERAVADTCKWVPHVSAWAVLGKEVALPGRWIEEFSGRAVNWLSNFIA